MEEEQRDGFTNIPEVDVQILLNLSSVDLNNICHVNNYFYSLCHNHNVIWRRKIADEISLKLSYDKPSNILWQQWYFYLSSHPDDVKLTNLLNLNTQQSIIYFITRQGGLTVGSEAFLTIDVTLERAFKSGNRDLVSYFMDELSAIYDKYYETSKKLEEERLIISLLPYKEIIILALEQGFSTEAEDILVYMIYDEGRYNDLIPDYDDYFELVQYFGKHKMVNLFEIVDEHITNEFTNEMWLSEYYLLGLIEGHHNKEAEVILKSIIPKWEKNSDRNHLIYEIINQAQKVNNNFFLDLIKEYFPGKYFYTNLTPEKEKGIKRRQDPNYEEVFRLINSNPTIPQLRELCDTIRYHKDLYLYAAINYILLYSNDWNNNYPVYYDGEKYDFYDSYEIYDLKVIMKDTPIEEIPTKNYYDLLTYFYS